MITITDEAKKKLNQRAKGSEVVLRIRVKSGGCSGMTYDAEIDGQYTHDDNIVQKDSAITVVSDQESLPFLEGLEIDYSDDLISVGFRFSNDSNDSSCGCGASFSLAGFPAQLAIGGSCGN